MLRLVAVVSFSCLATVQPVSAAPPVAVHSSGQVNAMANTYPLLSTEAFTGEYFVIQRYRDMLG